MGRFGYFTMSLIFILSIDCQKRVNIYELINEFYENWYEEEEELLNQR